MELKTLEYYHKHQSEAMFIELMKYGNETEVKDLYKKDIRQTYYSMERRINLDKHSLYAAFFYLKMILPRCLARFLIHSYVKPKPKPVIRTYEDLLAEKGLTQEQIKWWTKINL